MPATLTVDATSSNLHVRAATSAVPCNAWTSSMLERQTAVCALHRIEVDLCRHAALRHLAISVSGIAQILSLQSGISRSAARSLPMRNRLA